MPDRYSTGRETRRYPDERPVRSASRPASGARPAGQRPAGSRPAGARPASARPQGARPAGARPQASRPAGQRPQGSRPPQGRRPAPRRRKRTQPRFFIFIAVIAIILIVALVLILGGGKGKDKTVVPQATPTAAPVTSGMDNATLGTNVTGDFSADMAAVENNPQAASYSTLGEWLADSDAEVAALSEDETAKISNLSINPDLPSEWLNVLLLGTDERTLKENARTDTMIICSINTKTGEVKLSSIMRDMAVELTEVGKYNGLYRMNAVNYFGGPKYAMKVVNECFDMNIQYYASVNFYGFQKIAQALGGITVDITEAEMEHINKNAVEQAWMAYREGIDESDQINEYLTTYGPNTQLNGRQTLAYARIRKIDSDFTRAERQRTVLVELLKKLKSKSVTELLALVSSMSGSISTNMDLSVITEVALTVMQSGLSDVETMRLPANGTYTEERREKTGAMLYDTDWETNTLLLYNFIYE